ncbi:MAG: hypothetical protein ACK5HP_04235 [Bacilli bacterium]
MKKLLIIPTILIVIVLIITGILIINNKNEINITDATKFKEEYEEFNNKKTRSGDTYLSLSISEENIIEYSSVDKILELLESGTGVIYFGYPECPWCRNIVPVLLEATEEMGVETIYYYDPSDIRDTKTLNESGEIVITNEGTNDYKKIVEKLYDFLTPYTGLNDDSIKRLYVPTVVFVDSGEIIGVHIGTVDSQTNPYIKLDEEETEELKNIYIEYIAKTYGLVCSEEC